MPDPVATVRTESDLSLVRRQAVAAARKLLTPTAYVGTAREAALTAFHVATYPFGVAPGLRRAERGSRPRSALQQSLLAHDPATACTPVLLVHGYFHNRSAFLLMSRTLNRVGFQHIHGINYNPLTSGIPELAAVLGGEVERVLKATGAGRCQIVGHSLGGMIARYYAQELGGEDTVDTVITLGTPHRGTYNAYAGYGPAAAQMRPGSELIRRLDESARPSDVRYVSYYSDLDLLITPAVNAKLTTPALQATNIRLRDTGHLSLLLSGEVLGGVVDHLIHREANRPQALPTIATMPTKSQRLRRGAVDVQPPEAAATAGMPTS